MLNEQQKQKFELTRQMAKEELEQLDREISLELAKVKDKLLELQQARSREAINTPWRMRANGSQISAGNDRFEFYRSCETALNALPVPNISQAFFDRRSSVKRRQFPDLRHRTCREGVRREKNNILLNLPTPNSPADADKTGPPLALKQYCTSPPTKPGPT